MSDYSNLVILKVDEIDMNDYPEFSDAYISKAEKDGRLLHQDELDALNDNIDSKLYDRMFNFIIQRNA
jgi:hypothetical protein